MHPLARRPLLVLPLAALLLAALSGCPNAAPGTRQVPLANAAVR